MIRSPRVNPQGEFWATLSPFVKGRTMGTTQVTVERQELRSYTLIRMGIGINGGGTQIENFASALKNSAMKFAILGAGGVGGYYGGLLAQNGHDVCVLARTSNLAALREHGSGSLHLTVPLLFKFKQATT